MKYLFYSEEPEEGGTVSASPEPENDQYPDGASVMLAAVPAEGWEFTHWSERDYMPHTDPELTVIMIKDRAIAAHFYKPRKA